MKILIGCEESGTVREMFSARGHDAWSCDLKPSRIRGKHIQGDLLNLLWDDWDLLIAHPPCTRLCVAGNAHRGAERSKDEQFAIDFFMYCVNSPIPKICVENPIGIMSSLYRKPDQIVEPYYFGDTARKPTCLWLKNLPKLFYATEDDLFSKKTSVDPSIKTMVSKKTGKKRTYSEWEYHASNNHRERAEIRSKTFPGIAKAMVEQWG